jgi:predicted DNA-binding protein YlxM (UPF0122 family)
MKATLNELCEMFKLKNARQLKAGLNNKIKVVDASSVKITDAKLMQLFEGFSKGGAMTEKEVCRQYNIEPYNLRAMVKQGLISSYRLKDAKASKFLFLKSEVEKEKEFLLTYSSRKDIFKFVNFAAEMLERLSEEFLITPREFEVFRDYYLTSLTLEEIAEKYKVTEGRIRSMLQHRNGRLIHHMVDFLKNHDKYDKALEEIGDLKTIIYRQKVLLDNYTQVEKSFESLDPAFAYRKQFRETKISEFDFSTRTLNALKGGHIETVEQLLSHSKSRILMFRNLGKKAVAEINDVLKKKGIIWI